MDDIKKKILGWIREKEEKPDGSVDNKSHGDRPKETQPSPCTINLNIVNTGMEFKVDTQQPAQQGPQQGPQQDCPQKFYSAAEPEGVYQTGKRSEDDRVSEEQSPGQGIYIGPEHLSDKQAGNIRELAEKLSHMEKTHARHRASVNMILGKLQTELHVADYRLILRKQYAEAVKILHGWQSKAQQDSERPAAILEERSAIYRQCHAIAKQYGLYQAMRLHMQTRWQAESMREMEDQALRDLLSFMCVIHRHRFNFLSCSSSL